MPIARHTVTALAHEALLYDGGRLPLSALDYFEMPLPN